jgi:arginyl-tRNA synthetase
MKTLLTKIFKSAIHSAFNIDCDPAVQSAARPEYGDYQANFAMKLTKQLQKKPNEIAQQVLDHLLGDPSSQAPRDDNRNILFEKLEISGPGFINITVSNLCLENYLQELVGDKRLGVAQDQTPKTIVVDYGGANVAKEMHVGHLRSAVIGDAIVRILGFLGHKVIRQNHLGDWGTQFGMLIEHMIEHFPSVLSCHPEQSEGSPKSSGDPSSQAPRDDSLYNLSDLNIYYKQAKQRFDEDAVFAEKARQRVVALQSGDQKTLAVWRHLVEESKHQFQKAYNKLNLLMTEEDACGESFYNDKLSAVIKEVEEKKLAEISDDALVIFLEGFVDPDGKPVPLIVRKKDGGYLYATTDLTAIKYRAQELQANRIIYVVDARQKQHLAMVFAAAQKAGWIDGMQVEHLPFGSVLGEDHRPFKTRSGESVKLNDLLNEAESRAIDIARKKNPELSDEQIKTIAQAIGIGALKYADLRSDSIKDYVFNWERMLSFEGNTAPYLQNAYVRIRSIFRKGNINVADLNSAEIKLTTEIEHKLAVKLLELPDLINSVAEDLAIHRLCEYLYDVAATFHRFYEHCPILNADDSIQRNSRLLLCDITARTLQLGLDLLGIKVLEMM